MKKKLRNPFSRRAFTLIEMLISTAIIGITGSIVYYILFTGMTLFAKNTAINIAHQEARVAVLQMEQDLHSAISIPTLTDASRVAVSGNGPAAGISFQVFAGGPFKITPSTTKTPSNGYGYAATQPKITVRLNSFPIDASLHRLIIPTHQLESDIQSAGATGTDVQLTLPTNLGVEVNTTLNTDNTPAGMKDVNVACFLTYRVYYVVVDGKLWYYRNKNDTKPKMMANDITTATPFSIPATPLGAPYNRFVAAINLSTADTSTTNRHFRAANMFLNAMEPYRARLCMYQ